MIELTENLDVYRMLTKVADRADRDLAKVHKQARSFNESENSAKILKALQASTSLISNMADDGRVVGLESRRREQLREALGSNDQMDINDPQFMRTVTQVVTRFSRDRNQRSERRIPSEPSQPYEEFLAGEVFLFTQAGASYTEAQRIIKETIPSSVRVLLKNPEKVRAAALARRGGSQYSLLELVLDLRSPAEWFQTLSAASVVSFESIPVIRRALNSTVARMAASFVFSVDGLVPPNGDPISEAVSALSMTINAGNPTLNNSSDLAGEIAGILVEGFEYSSF